MEFVEALMGHPTYRFLASQLEEQEKERIFCRHDIDHSLHVARIAYIISLEQKLGIPKEAIYLCALLHDLGRTGNDRGGSHAAAAAVLAEELLTDIGYPRQRQGEILAAIASHGTRADRERLRDRETESDLTQLLQTADQLSRNCFACQARELCHWREEEKNLFVEQ